MIFYFSGTGNSRYVAKRVATVTGDTLCDMGAKIKKKECQSGVEEKNLVFVTPTYAWRIPKVAERWIAGTAFAQGAKAWFVMTCGGEIGNAAKYNKRLCDKKGLTYMGTAQILMPENYIAMFNAPDREEAEKIIEKAEPDIAKAADAVKRGEAFGLPRNNLYDRVMSDAVNPVFYKLFVKADAFATKESCTGCGKCVTLCPLNNISLKDGRPQWGKNCTHCMACICHCPQEAIEYGKKSAGKPRYRCPK